MKYKLDSERINKDASLQQLQAMKNDWLNSYKGWIDQIMDAMLVCGINSNPTDDWKGPFYFQADDIRILIAPKEGLGEQKYLIVKIIIDDGPVVLHSFRSKLEELDSEAPKIDKFIIPGTWRETLKILFDAKDKKDDEIKLAGIESERAKIASQLRVPGFMSLYPKPLFGYPNQFEKDSDMLLFN